MPFCEIAGVQIEYEVRGAHDAASLVFLHEGLGSIQLWRDFPDQVTAATGETSLVYSRHGHGWSDPLTEPRPIDFMHREALDTLPALLDRLATPAPVLIGHSDGASIALIHTGLTGRPIAGLVAIAPHVFVEPRALEGAAAARRAFERDGLAERMAKYHHDPAATFFGWYDVWQDAAFRRWNIEHALSGIECPVLLIQGEDDEYGTVAQIDAIQAGVSGPVERLWLAECGHSAHLDQPVAVTAAIVEFVLSLRN